MVPFRQLRLLNSWPDFWDDSNMGWSANQNSLDISETEDEVVVKANVAGVELKDIELVFEEGVLWIKASKREEDLNEDKTHYARSSWSYSYKVAVPGNIDLSKEPEAILDNGVLAVTFPKLEAYKPKKLSVKLKTK